MPDQNFDVKLTSLADLKVEMIAPASPDEATLQAVAVSEHPQILVSLSGLPEKLKAFCTAIATQDQATRDFAFLIPAFASAITFGKTTGNVRLRITEGNQIQIADFLEAQKAELLVVVTQLAEDVAAAKRGLRSAEKNVKSKEQRDYPESFIKLNEALEDISQKRYYKEGGLALANLKELAGIIKSYLGEQALGQTITEVIALSQEAKEAKKQQVRPLPQDNPQPALSPSEEPAPVVPQGQLIRIEPPITPASSPSEEPARVESQEQLESAASSLAPAQSPSEELAPVVPQGQLISAAAPITPDPLPQVTPVPVVELRSPTEPQLERARAWITQSQNLPLIDTIRDIGSIFANRSSDIEGWYRSKIVALEISPYEKQIRKLVKGGLIEQDDNNPRGIRFTMLGEALHKEISEPYDWRKSFQEANRQWRDCFNEFPGRDRERNFFLTVAELSLQNDESCEPVLISAVKAHFNTYYAGGNTLKSSEIRKFSRDLSENCSIAGRDSSLRLALIELSEDQESLTLSDHGSSSFMIGQLSTDAGLLK